MARKTVNQKNSWIVLTGAPSSGKTTLLQALEKHGYQVVYELAREYIDQELAKGRTILQIRENELAFQQTVLQLKADKERTIPSNKYIFFERGIPDSMAYYDICGVKRDALLERYCNSCSYMKVFLLELPQFIPDYARTEDENLAKRLERLLEVSYTSLGMPVNRIPPISLEDRLEFLLKLL